MPSEQPAAPSGHGTSKPFGIFSRNISNAWLPCEANIAAAMAKKRREWQAKAMASPG